METFPTSPEMRKHPVPWNYPLDAENVDEHLYLVPKINNTPISTVKEITHLGVTMTSLLSQVLRITKTLGHATSTLGAICPIIKYDILTPQKVRLFCYKQLIRTFLIFGFIFRSDFSSFQIERLRH